MTGRGDRLQHGLERLPHLVEVAEGFEDEAVHAALHEPVDLPVIELLGLFTGRRSERLDTDAQRPDGPDHQSPTLG